MEDNLGLESFFFMVFQPNPSKDNVRVVVDGGDVKFTMKRDRFYRLINRILGPDMESKVHNACTDYGDFFLLDRQNNSVKMLHPTSENEKLNPSQVVKDIREELEASEGFEKMAAEYSKMTQEYYDQSMSDNTTLNKKPLRSGFIDYTEKARKK